MYEYTYSENNKRHILNSTCLFVFLRSDTHAIKTPPLYILIFVFQTQDIFFLSLVVMQPIFENKRKYITLHA